MSGHVVHTGRRRRWSPEEKLRIVVGSFAGHRQVSAIARRHDISRSQLYAWRRALDGGCRGHDEVPGFWRTVMVSETARGGLVCAGAGRMEVVTAGGDRIIVGADVDGAAFARVLSVLEARR